MRGGVEYPGLSVSRARKAGKVPNTHEAVSSPKGRAVDSIKKLSGRSLVLSNREAGLHRNVNDASGA